MTSIYDHPPSTETIREMELFFAKYSIPKVKAWLLEQDRKKEPTK